jgi:cyclic pyranopterin phosphate synthase
LSEDTVHMVDISNKPVVKRVAEAVGELVLRSSTIDAIKSKSTKKGDVLAISEIAGIQAAKRTWDLIPLCHQIPLTSVNISFEIGTDRVQARCNVNASYSTGVEMEALVGVSVALLSVWDMVKYLEKDENGQYPIASIEEIRVTKKTKEAV